MSDSVVLAQGSLSYIQQHLNTPPHISSRLKETVHMGSQAMEAGFRCHWSSLYCRGSSSSVIFPSLPFCLCPVVLGGKLYR